MIDNIIAKTEKMTALLNEYKQSLIYEKCLYHIIRDENCLPFERYFLYRIADKSRLLYGAKDRLIHYINLRRIPTETIYNSNLLILF